MKQKVLKYDVIFEEQSVGGYAVTVPSLQGCISEGNTFEEAKENIVDAIKLYLEDMQVDGEEMPKGDSNFFLVPVEVDLKNLHI